MPPTNESVPPTEPHQPGTGADVMQRSAEIPRPRSVVHAVVAAAGLIGYLGAAAILYANQPFGIDVANGGMFLIGVAALAIFIVDLGWLKAYRRPSTGLDFAYDDPSWTRTGVKLLGLVVTLALIAFAYWAFPEYQDKLFEGYWQLLGVIVPPWLILAIPYFYFVDRKMPSPHDGYWHVGQAALLNFREVDREAVVQHALGWIIKAFFLALMFGFLCNDVKWLYLLSLDRLDSFSQWYDFSYQLGYFIDVGIACVGYIMAFRITDTHIRSSEPTLFGWVIALLCYPPFWNVVYGRYLRYETGYPWSAWLGGHPVLYVAWGTGILVLLAIYVWATVIFAARFSNLTHRGIITNGPYRWIRHPAYLAKNLSWWMVSVPFMPRGTTGETVARCAMLLGVNLIYYLRAKTEERHLSRDPVYVQYALWIEQHGLLRFMKRLPLLRRLAYRPPAQWAAAA